MNIFIIALTTLLFIVGYYAEIGGILPLYGVSLVAFMFYYFRTLNKSNPIYLNWLCPSYILLLGLVIVCFQTPINIFLGLAPFTTYMPCGYEPHLVKCTYLGLISVLGFMCGGMINPRCKLPIISHNVKYYAVWPWLILMPVVLCLFIININIASFISGAEYMGSGGFDRVGNMSAYFEQLLDVVIVIVTALKTHNLMQEDNKINLKCFISSFPFIYWIVVIIYILLRMLSGDRGPVLYTSSLVFFAYLMCSKRKFKWVSLTVIIVSAAFVTTLLGIVRGGNLNQAFTERIETALEGNLQRKPSFMPFTQELANSINTEFIAVDAMSEPDPQFSCGKYTFYALLGSVPGSSYVLSNLFDVNMRSTMSSEYITIYDKGSHYSFGLGTSPMAEFYLEFGMWGCFFGLMFLGWIFSYVNQIILGKNRNISIYLVIFALKMSSIAIYIPRSSVASCMSKAFYIMIIFGLMNFVFRAIKINQSYKGN